MKTLLFKVDVPDKYTKERYFAGQVKRFEDERAEEILRARQSNGRPFAEIVEEIETAVIEEEKEEAVQKTVRKKRTKWHTEMIQK